MALKKPGSPVLPPSPEAAATTAAAPSTQAAPSTTAAAVDRLNAPKPVDTGTPAKSYGPKEEEARGKTRCVMFAAALSSPALAGLKFKGIEEYLVLVEKAAVAGVKYSFGD